MADSSDGVATPGLASLDVVCSVGTNVPSSDIFIVVPFLHNPWKEAVANNPPPASFAACGAWEGSVFLGLDIQCCLMFLEGGLASLRDCLCSGVALVVEMMLPVLRVRARSLPLTELPLRCLCFIFCLLNCTYG